MNPFEERLREVERRHQETSRELADPGVTSDPARLRELSREHARLSEVVEATSELGTAREELEGARELLRESPGDAEMAALAREEVDRLTAEVEQREVRLRDLVVPHDPLDDRDAVVEVRAGTGGDEAALFAHDLLRMYTRYAESKGWKVEPVSVSEGSAGGIKETVVVLRGANAFGTLRYESGTHRVQRVPATESQGRIHTSAATVAVLPEAGEVDVELHEQDLRVDVFRSSGPGGQSVNTTDSAVRVTHLPSGLVVSCQDEKSQHKNKDKALRVLRSRLLDLKISEREAERARARKLQVGTGDRSAKIRTYNFPQSRVTDHRIGYTTHSLGEVLDGALDELIERLQDAVRGELAA
ncbi:MAG: peptide chain release factor 1 [Longimicrobiaceae bacterium]